MSAGGALLFLPRFPEQRGVSIAKSSDTVSSSVGVLADGRSFRSWSEQTGMEGYAVD